MGLIRLLLAISVVLAHSDSLFGVKLWGGVMAVEMFFIISGFYMALILNEKYNSPDKTIIFYKNRLLKLLPIYWTVLSLTLLLSIVSYFTFNKGGTLLHFIDDFDDLGFFAFYVVFSNVFLMGQDLLMFLGLNEEGVVLTKSFSDTSTPLHKFIIIPQAWTLSLEIVFYLMAPFLLRKKLK
jgi:peptidoglycan/LPS O-acetylase OafA/YrhL